MTYEDSILEYIDPRHKQSPSGVAGGKRLALSLLELKLLEAGIVPTGDMQEVMETLRKEFNTDLEEL